MARLSAEHIITENNYQSHATESGPGQRCLTAWPLELIYITIITLYSITVFIMAAHVTDIDTESQDRPISNEQTPLLIDQNTIEEANQDEIEAGRNSTSWYAWRILWAIVVALVLAVFIKGWIDAGADVDVCLSHSTLFIMDVSVSLTCICSLISKLPLSERLGEV